MFAVIRTGGKQYRVAKDDTIIVEKLLGEPGAMVELSDVLMIGGDGKAATVGAPLVDKAAVFAEVLEQSRADKILVFKKNRRKNYRRTKGHRQEQTVLLILDVSPTGTKPKAAAKAAPHK
ncbi:MAG: 50S ribosomal protein L21, partial [Rhodospirillales bacterium]|nr:50S ribosomal protein L21 [Rhodospirillales bacterium]